MEIREVTTHSEKAPFSGYGVWIVFELKYHKVCLLHPVTLTELYLHEYEYVRDCGNSLWPINTTGKMFNSERFLRNFKERIKTFTDNDRSIPAELCARVISELEDMPLDRARGNLNEIALESGKELKAGVYYLDKNFREFSLREGADTSKIRGRPLAIVEALRDHGPATMVEITELVDGKLKTKCKLSRAVTYFVNKMTSQGILEIVA